MLKHNIEELTNTGNMGDWCFTNEDLYICLMWGNDPFKNMSILPIKPTDGKPSWNWNGSHEYPTLTPSILVHPYPDWTDGWHGYLTDGKLIQV